MKVEVFLPKKLYLNIFYEHDLPLIYAIQIFHSLSTSIKFISKEECHTIPTPTTIQGNFTLHAVIIPLLQSKAHSEDPE